MNNLNNLSERISALESEIRYLENLIAAAPEGRLIARSLKSGGYRYSVKRPDADNKVREDYLAAEELATAKALALRDYAKQRILDAKQEKHYLQLEFNYLTKEKNAESFLKAHPGAAELVNPLIRKRSEQLEAWKNAPYERSTEFPEHLIYPTIIPGFMVRSKAEADILGRFEFFGAAYHYEEELRCGNDIIHPDFTCKNLSTGKTIYWEHQGGWDDPGYVRRLNRRNEIYCKLGISPGDNLIITAETGSHPLDIQWVDQLIQYYLL